MSLEIINKIRGHEIYKSQPLPVYSGSVVNCTIYYTINNKTYNFLIKFMVEYKSTKENGSKGPTVNDIIELITKGFISDALSSVLSRQVKISAIRLKAGEVFDTGRILITGYYGKQEITHEPYPMQFILSTINPTKQQSLRLYGVPTQFEYWDQEGSQELLTFVEQFCSGFQKKITSSSLSIYSVGIHPFKTRITNFTRVSSVIPTNFIRDKKVLMAL